MTSTTYDRCAKCGYILGPKRRIIGEFSYHTDCAPDTTGYATTMPVIREQPVEMTLRDYFAGMALMGSIAFPTPGQEKIPENAARWAYIYADAMLEARKAKQ